MSAPLRFLAIVAVGWVAFRIGAIGAMPGGDMFSLKEADAAATPAPAVQPVQQVSQPPATAEEQAYAYPGYAPYARYPPYPPYAQNPAYAPGAAMPFFRR